MGDNIISIKKAIVPLVPTNSKSTPRLALTMMVKNEKKKILTTLESIKGIVDYLIVYDTGSTDNTIELITNFSSKNNIKLFLITGEFVDFATSRNILLDYADTIDVRYLLLLDTNDELRNGKNLLKFLETQDNTTINAYFMCQNWQTANLDQYWNIRLLKNHEGWRYKGVVHEWLRDTKSNTDEPRVLPYRIEDGIVIYQDRRDDDDKTLKRFAKDKIMLIKEHKENPNDYRTLFYLAQTCSCLRQLDDAIYYSKLRLELDGFPEERYHSIMRIADCLGLLRQPWEEQLRYYSRAIENFPYRAEAYFSVSEYYFISQKYELSYMYANRCCDIPYPEHLLLFVDKSLYAYKRFKLLALVTTYNGKHDEGLAAIKTAIKNCGDNDVEKSDCAKLLEHHQKYKFFYETKAKIVEKARIAGKNRTNEDLDKEAWAYWEITKHIKK